MNGEYFLALLDSLQMELDDEKNASAKCKPVRKKEYAKKALQLVGQIAEFKKTWPGIAVMVSNLRSAVSQFYEGDHDLAYQWAKNEICKLKAYPGAFQRTWGSQESQDAQNP